jgi:voltage-gated potassium channel
MTPPAPRIRRRTLRATVREVMEPYTAGPGSTWLSLAVDVVVLGCILASCTMVVLEWVRPRYIDTFHPFEVTFTLIFIVEYLLRWYSAENRWTYPFRALAIVDLLAIVPGVLMLGSDMFMLRMIRGVRFLRLLRLLRLIRLLRLLRYGPLIYRGLLHARVWFSSIAYQYRLGELGKLCVIAVVVLFVGANVIHLTERAMGGDRGPFGGYWSSYWHILIVLVSGIEDKEPISLLGRFEITALLVAGVVIVGLLTGEIVSILIRRAQRAGKVQLKPPSGRFERHIVILGVNRHLDQIIRQLHAALRGQHHVLVVCSGADELPMTDPKIYRRVYALAGEPRHSGVLDRSEIDQAARAIVLAPDADGCDANGADNRALMVTVAAVCRRRQVPMAVELTDEDSLRYTHGLPEVDFVVGRAFGERMLSQAVLNPGITEVYDHLLTFSGDTNEIYRLPVPGHLVGSSFSEAQLHYLDNDDETVTLIGLDRPGDDGEGRFSLSPLSPSSCLSGEELTLREHDRLILMAYHRPMGPRAGDPWSTTWLMRDR